MNIVIALGIVVTVATGLPVLFQMLRTHPKGLLVLFFAESAAVGTETTRGPAGSTPEEDLEAEADATEAAISDAVAADVAAAEGGSDPEASPSTEAASGP